MTDQRYMRPGLDFARGKAIEECGELLAALGKSLRWGWLSVNPELQPEQQETNLDWVKREIADVRGALDNLDREMTAGFMHSAETERVMHERMICTAADPWKPGDMRVHPDAREVHDSQREGYLGGDLVTYECPHCKQQFEIELPQ